MIAQLKTTFINFVSIISQVSHANMNHNKDPDALPHQSIVATVHSVPGHTTSFTQLTLILTNHHQPMISLDKQTLLSQLEPKPTLSCRSTPQLPQNQRRRVSQTAIIGKTILIVSFLTMLQILNSSLDANIVKKS